MIYIVESKLNSKKIKIGSTSNQVPKQRLKNYATYGGIKIIFACKYNDFSNIETALHIYFGDFFDTNVDGNEWFDFSKKTNQEFIYRISPFLLTSSIDVYKDTFFDYSNEFWEKFDNWLKEHSNDNCKKYNSFLKNKNYTDYREFVLSNSGSDRKKPKQNAVKKDKTTTIQQPQQGNDKPCKYETPCKNGIIIDWNLFFEDNQQLVGKSVYPFRKVNEIGKIIKLKSPKRGANFGILYKNREMSFNEFINENRGKNRYNAYINIYFQDTNKTIKQTYNELKFK